MTNKALLIGINYVGTENELGGCANDVTSIRDLLRQNGFEKSNITIISDDHPDAIITQPTKQNLKNQMNYFFAKCKGR